jgi:Kef-type K+ transport system membrane component KefB/Trk K+ transport system NAD-binding subunit
MLNYLTFLASSGESVNLSVFNEIALIIAVGTGVALIMRLLRQPLIMGHIITGIIVGPSVFDLIKSEETITVFAKLGIALLLFIIGLGLNPKVIKEVGKPSVIAGGIQVVATTAISYLIAKMLGFDNVSALISGIAMAFSSTIIILKLISDKKEQNRLYAKLSVGMLLIQDIIATIALLFVSSPSAGEGGISSADIGLLVVKGTAGILLLYVVAEEILPRARLLISGSQEFLFLFALSWGLGIAALFEIAGFSLEVGALLAGVGLATQTYTQEISSRLKPLRDFFVVVFFISLGSELVLDNLMSILTPAIVLSITVIIVNPIVVMTALGMLGYTRKTSFKAGVGMAQISEFSLVFAILAQRQGRISDETLSILTLVGLITIAISTYMIVYADGMYKFFESHFKLFEQKKVKYDQKEASTYPVVLFGYKRGGSDYISTFRKMKKKFVVIDYDPEVIDILEQSKLHYIYGDATDLELLDEVGIESSKLIVSTLGEHEINLFITTNIHALNPNAVIICHSDSAQNAIELYEHGASYVVLTHAIGTEKISSFIRKNGLKVSEFKKYREKHVSSLLAQAQEISK